MAILIWTDENFGWSLSGLKQIFAPDVCSSDFFGERVGPNPNTHQWQLRRGRTNMALGRLEGGVVELVKFAALETKEVVVIGGG